IEVWRLIKDSDASEQPLGGLEEKVFVLEKTEHAQGHAKAGDEPSLLAMSIFRLADLPPAPENHRRGGEKERGKWRIPCAIENVTRNDEKIFSQIPTAKAPVDRRDDDVENDEGERIEKHDEPLRITLPMAAVHLRQPYCGRCLDGRCRSSKT